MHIVADTDFLSAFFKIGRVDLIYEALAADKIYITQAVFDELAKAPFFYDFVRKVERIERISVDKISRDIQSAMLGKGESESISYALKTDSILLSNDKKAGEFAEDLGIKVLDVVSFLLLCRDTGVLSANDIEHVINMLKKHDYMGLSQEQRRLLIEE